MSKKQRLGWLGTALVLTGLTGCQTWVGGMTLPSGHYLEHPPQYIPESPPFPLQRELATMEAQAAQAAQNAAPGVPGQPMAPGPVARPVQ